MRPLRIRSSYGLLLAVCLVTDAAGTAEEHLRVPVQRAVPLVGGKPLPHSPEEVEDQSRAGARTFTFGALGSTASRAVIKCEENGVAHNESLEVSANLYQRGGLWKTSCAVLFGFRNKRKAGAGLPGRAGRHLLDHGQDQLAIAVIQADRVTPDLAEKAHFIVGELRQSFVAVIVARLGEELR